MNLETRTLADYLDEWLRDLSPVAKTELRELVVACGGPAAGPETEGGTPGASRRRGPQGGQSS
jgi:hypothetical protein